MDYYGLMMSFHRSAAFIVLSAALFASPAIAQSTDTAPAPNEASPGQSDSGLSAELFYQLLLGELNAIGGEPGVGFSIMLDAARKTGDARLFKRATEIALRARSGDSALQAARAWRTAMPQSREANRYVLQILIGLNRLGEAIDPLKRDLALAPAPERIAVINSIPTYFSRAADKAGAADVVAQALAAQLEDQTLGPAAWTSIGRLRAAGKDATGALEAALRGQELDPGADGPAILALTLFGSGTNEAESVVLRYLDHQPRFEVRMDYATALLGRQRYAESAMQLERVTREKPEYARAWLIKGTLEQQNRQPEQARASLLRFVELATQVKASPDETEEPEQALTQAYLRLAELAEQRRDYTAAQDWLARIDNAQSMVSVQSRRAAILARQGKLAEARAMIRALPEKEPADARMKISAEVQILRDNKQYQLAYDVLRGALAADPNDTDLQYDLSMIAEKLGRLDEMERVLRALIAAKPDYHHAYNALGYSLADRNVRLPEARELILKALEYAPGDPFISDSLAWVEYRSGNHAEALRILKKAYADKPDAEIAAHLGEVMWTLGQKDEAMAVWREGLGLNADNETLLETIKRFRVNP
ncbi:MAG: tetratricopeptide repeat protein [Rhodoferax sp.]|nr:tetratricopeptide repeat protein [Rhodoferax sp.]MCB2029525.1 tetratricopeptide repeat protein [Rhodoferax sp.]